MKAGISWEKVRWRDRASMKPMKVSLMIAAFAVGLLAFSLANPSAAEAWLHHGPTTQYPSTGGK